MTNFTLCASRPIGHDWNLPENQRWEMTDPIRRGRRSIARVLRISTCTRCLSQRIEPFSLDSAHCLAEKLNPWYRHSRDYKNRDRLSAAELNWRAIPAKLRREL